MAVRQFSHIVKPFFGAHLAEMQHLLHITSTVITGPCATGFPTGEAMTRNDLNLITPSGGAEAVNTFLVGELRYERVDGIHVSHPNNDFGNAVKSFTTLRKGPWIITVAEANEENLLALSHSG